MFKIQDLADSLFQLAHEATAIAITTHLDSDGDGMVAAFALQRILTQQAYASTIVTDGESLKPYAFLGEQWQAQSYSSTMHFDLVIVLDCNSLDRLGARAQMVHEAKIVLVIDHHIIEHNPILTKFSWIDPSFAATGAQIYTAFAAVIATLPPADQLYIANCVYVTLLNDTNNFSNANTDADVFHLAARLMQHGIKPHLLYMAFMQSHSATEMRYIGLTLATIELHHQDEVLYMHSNYALAEACELNPQSVKKATQYAQGIAGVKALVYFREDEPSLWKVSLRSLSLDVQKIAALFGGGGHQRASGFRKHGKLPEIKQALLQVLSSAIEAI